MTYMVGWIRSLGYKRIVLRSDGEPSLVALLQDVSAQLPEVEIAPKNSAVGDHQQNGLAEVAVREVKAQARILRSHLESCYKQRFRAGEPILAWLVRHGANSINRNRVGVDGRSPERRRRKEMDTSMRPVWGMLLLQTPRGEEGLERRRNAHEERCLRRTP